MVFEYRVLREMFVSKKEEMTESWSKLCSEELQGWYWTAWYCICGYGDGTKDDERSGACGTELVGLLVS
jgi:hypothetical protein